MPKSFIAEERNSHPELSVDSDAHDKWFRGKVLEAMNSSKPHLSHAEVKAQTLELIKSKMK